MRRLHLMEEAERCLLCLNAPCSKVCTNADPARGLRAVRFDNAANAHKWFEGASEQELEEAEKACIHYDRPIRIREIAKIVAEQYPKKADTPKPSLEIDFCGLHCENPFFLASSAICTNYEMVSSALEAGWAGVFYKTICLEEIKEVSPRFDVVKNPDGSFAGFRNMEQLSENPADVDFQILSNLKRNYPGKIVIASIMGNTEQQWIDLAKMAEDAGVDAVELNFSCPQMKLSGMGSDVGQNMELVAIYTSYVKNAVKIPVIPKMTPNVDTMAKFALSCHFAGADGISAINTIKSMSEGSRISGKRMVSGYSGKAVKPIALRFILEMAQNHIMKNLQLSGIGGITTWRDALDFIQLGCRNTQICTAVMEYGYRIIDDLKEGLSTYMAERGVTSLEQLVGEEVGSFATTSEIDRDTKVFPTVDRSVCIGCGRCYISCSDGGHQAISFGEDRQPKIIGQKCVGCHLCRMVCPTGAIGMANRIPKK